MWLTPPCTTAPRRWRKQRRWRSPTRTARTSLSPARFIPSTRRCSRPIPRPSSTRSCGSRRGPMAGSTSQSWSRPSLAPPPRSSCSNPISMGCWRSRRPSATSPMGGEGLKQLAELSAQRAHHLAAQLVERKGYRLAFDGPFLWEFVMRTPYPAEQTQAFMLERGVLPGLPLGRFFPELSDALLISVTELNHPKAIERFLEALA